jgi:hypothetical protein
MSHTIDDCRTVELPMIPDARGNLTPVEAHAHVPFAIRRVSWINGLRDGSGHASRDVEEMIIAVSGCFDVTLDDGTRRRTQTLNRAYVGLYVPSTIARELEGFSTNAVCLVLASEAA